MSDDSIFAARHSVGKNANMVEQKEHGSGREKVRQNIRHNILKNKR